MNNAGKQWSPEENGTLIREYNVHQLDILEIAKRHGRTPVSIMCKLKANNVIHNDVDARGYADFMAQKTANPAAFVNTSAPSVTNGQLLKEIGDMKNEIRELRDEIRELTALMRASFEFTEEEVTA